MEDEEVADVAERLLGVQGAELAEPVAQVHPALAPAREAADAVADAKGRVDTSSPIAFSYALRSELLRLERSVATALPLSMP